MGMKIWVVGAKGLLGSSLLEMAPDLCIGTDKEIADVGDFTSLRYFLTDHPEITHIVNCSAFSLVDRAESEREMAFRANAIGPENLGKVAQEKGVSLVHISTDYVFPGDGNRPLVETDLVKPLNYYGETKLEGERRLAAIMPSACIIRTSALFGARGRNFIARLLELFREKEEIFLSDDQWNSPTYAEDLAATIIQMVNEEGLFHYANRGSASKFSFASEVHSFALKHHIPFVTQKLTPCPSSTFPSPCKRPPYSVFDTTKIEMHLSRPIRPWQEALHAFLTRCLCAR